MKHLPTVDQCSTCALGRVSPKEGCPFHDVSWTAGALLLRQGEVPSTIFYLREGTVLLSSSTASGEETDCALRGAGAMIGLEALTSTAAGYEAWALSDVVVCRIDVASFHKWFGSPDTPAAVIATKALEEGERRRRERVTLSGRAEQRVARFLLERARLEGDNTPLPVEQQVLARMLGMKPETLSRALAKLRERGALEQGRGVRVHSVEVLEQIAENL